ncbi:MAG: PSD1 and planctomycete cytochrome C domain-containing protein [Planctomycetaceae bacterium]
MNRRPGTTLLLLLAVFGFSQSAMGAEPAVDFARDIRPILSETCFKCHGFDDEARATDMRLDTREGLLAQVEEQPVVAPGDPAASLLYQRITAADPDLRMPPVDSNLTLTPAQQELIGRWIAEGAEWQSHWSLQPIRQPDIPVIEPANDRPQGGIHPIDAFVRARLQAEGLEPASAAEPSQLLRRVTLDLTGLPPTLAERDAFLSDNAEGAYERVVDRLLESPHFGERMAWDWLDAARYADSNGYQGDRERTMWPWRDWVVDAFNRNLPYDDFTIWQLAGDLLDNATEEQRLATGFCRNHMINGEGGRIAEENRVDYVMDMSETMGTVWLGLTLNCCRCHDHKYDPISNREYYELYAFFNQTPVTGGGGDPQTAPVLAVFTDDDRTEMARIDDELTRVESRLAKRGDELAESQAAWEADQLTALSANAWRPLAPVAATAERQSLRVLEDASVLAEGDAPPQDAYEVRAQAAPGTIAAIRLEALRHESHTQNSLSKADSGNFVLTDFDLLLVRAGASPDAAASLPLASATATFEQGDLKATAAIDDNPRTGWAVYEGKIVDREHAAVFLLAKPIELREGDTLLVRLRHDSEHVRHNLGRFRLSSSARADVTAQSDDSKLLAALSSVADARSAEQRQLLRDTRREDDANWRELTAEQQRLGDARKKIADAAPKVMVMADQPQPRESFMLSRGLYTEPGEPVSAGVPACLPPLASDVPANRLALARWLVADEHPLTARVTVNRIWQQFFGVGLVKTPEDFGTQGELPPHRDLLDWLAADFQGHGWDVKHLVRLIVTSQTYRQTSRVSPELYERDPENRLLARSARYRLPAWMIRDQALAASGLLVGTLGGRPVNGYQPAGVWEEATFGNKRYTQDHGDALYRRSLYTFWRRIVGPTMFFDSASRQTCSVKQVRTNTPLHALATFNDVTYVEVARVLAQRVLLAGHADDAARLGEVYRRVLAREPAAEEVAIWRTALDRARVEYATDAAAAAALLKNGESPRDESIDITEHAAWTALCLAILNLDEALTRP